MEYNSLISMYYKLNKKGDYKKEVENRINSYSTVKTDLFIKPVEKGVRLSEPTFELFYVLIRENHLLEYAVMENSSTIKRITSELPRSAERMLMVNYLVEEIKSSNDMEGVKSTRKEISDAIQNKSSRKKLRFRGIAKKYNNFLQDKFEIINNVETFRTIYDELFTDDIDISDMPDGELFRKDNVFVGKGNRNVHQGNIGEKSITDDLGKLIIFMNRKDLTPIIKAIITHYFFEYIHPFYDGNGRMGRFIMASYLARKLDLFTGVSISNSVFKNKESYRSMFVDTSNKRNCGDMTLFIHSFLKIITDGQEKIIDEFKSLHDRLSHARNNIAKLDITDVSRNVLFVIVQNYLFDSYSGQPLTDNEIMEIMDISRHILNKELVELANKGLVEKRGKRPTYHILSKKMEDILI